MGALSIHVLQRRRVYLDTRYWLILRDVAMGRPRRAGDVALLAALRRWVQAGVIVCPLGDGSLLEVLRQSDETTRLATARLIDELSLGVTIQNAQDRLTTEVMHFMLRVSLIRFGGHFPRGGYDVHNGSKDEYGPAETPTAVF